MTQADPFFFLGFLTIVFSGIYFNDEIHLKQKFKSSWRKSRLAPVRLGSVWQLSRYLSNILFSKTKNPITPNKKDSSVDAFPIHRILRCQTSDIRSSRSLMRAGQCRRSLKHFINETGA
jgi:hypothetical protein